MGGHFNPVAERGMKGWRWRVLRPVLTTPPAAGIPAERSLHVLLQERRGIVVVTTNEEKLPEGTSELGK